MTTSAHMAAGAAPRALFNSPVGGSLMTRGPQVTYGADDGAGGGGFSIDDAVTFLDQEEEAPAPAAAPTAAAAPAAGDEQQSEGAASTPDDTPDEAENHTQEGDETNATDEGAVEPIEPPKYWSQDAKAKFAALDPDLQAVVLAQEGPREEAAAKAKDEAAQVRAAAEKEIAGIQKFAEELQTFLPQAVQTFRSRWGDNPDWVAYAQQNGAEAMSIAKAQFEAERTTLQQLAQAQKEADGKAHQAYVAAEFKALETIAPELADPKEGAARRTEVTKYLQVLGIPDAALVRISAVEMSLARKAMLWDQSQAKTTLKPAPKPAPATTRPLARGAASVGSDDPKARTVATARARLNKTGSIDDAVGFLNTLGD